MSVRAQRRLDTVLNVIRRGVRFRPLLRASGEPSDDYGAFEENTAKWGIGIFWEQDSRDGEVFCDGEAHG